MRVERPLESEHRPQIRSDALTVRGIADNRMADGADAECDPSGLDGDLAERHAAIVSRAECASRRSRGAASHRHLLPVFWNPAQSAKWRGAARLHDTAKTSAPYSFTNFRSAN